jgi:hypothetical protein
MGPLSVIVFVGGAVLLGLIVIAVTQRQPRRRDHDGEKPLREYDEKAKRDDWV